MERATSLPQELWLLIFKLLSLEEVKQMILVHRVFHRYGQSFLWQTLTLCTLSERHYKKAQAIIRDPILAIHVKHLRLVPTNYDSETPNFRNPHKAPTNLWTCEGWRGALKPAMWKHPHRSFDHFRRSWTSQSTAIRVGPLLTEIRKLTVVTWSSEKVSPPVKPYLALREVLFPRLNQIRCLDLTLKSSKAISLFSTIFRGIVFDRLEVLNLDLAVGQRHPHWDDEFEETIRAIADTGRSSLQSLAVSMSLLTPFAVSDLRYPSLFSGLGCFPCLRHFQFTHCRVNGWVFRDSDVLAQFLHNHRSSLSKVGIYIPFPNTNLPFLEQTQSGGASKLKLVSIQIAGPLQRPFIPTGLQPYSDTLTTLVLDTTPPSPWSSPRGFGYQEIQELVLSLHSPSRGVLLRRLQIPIVNLSPEIFDLMSTYLENLHTLGLTYHILVGNENDSEAENEVLRCFPRWDLEPMAKILFISLHFATRWAAVPSLTGACNI
ncbi:hypothetical protein BDN72DRAFT_965341 [Pluteus cervinus]|uniref:Uncharacterized protein n=1 Tax=Pluteus cervinus TaxID=181527 RepID=A0ACD3A631_9AGAR|nr:hypothetical protein BDN72DRAFT_965341 [Pluteus cervinus]